MVKFRLRKVNISLAKLFDLLIMDLSVAANGWKKQLTYTSWNGRDPKFDLRSWSVDHKSMTKGLTLTKEEMIKLKEILNGIDFDKY